MNSKLTLTLASILLLLPVAALAQGYVPLVGIPGITDNGININTYINALYALSISIAALLAVVKIIIAGMKWMLSDVVTNKQEAITDIRGAVFGLVIVISAVLILTVINPQLTETQIFLEPVPETTRTPNAVTPGATPVSGTGYRYINLLTATSEVINTFRAECTAATGSINRRVTDIGIEVCYAPLPASVVANISRDFSGIPAATMTTVQRNFQTAHYPRLMSNTATIAQNHDTERVLLAVSITPQNDWLDRANLDSIRSTCAALQQSNQHDVMIVKGSGYVACVYPPVDNTAPPLGAGA